MTTKKSIIKVKNNGFVEYIFEEYEENPKTAEQIAADSAWCDDLFKEMGARNKLIHNIVKAIEIDDHSQFLNLIEQYHDKNEDSNEDIYIANRKKDIYVLLEVLQKEDNDYSIDNAIKYFSDDYINKSFIIIALWSLYHEEKTKELIWNHKEIITQEDYEVFFSEFKPDQIFQSKLPLGITDEKNFLENRKQEFFNLTKVILFNQINDKIPAKTDSGKKLKI